MGYSREAIFSSELFTNATTDDRSVKVDTSSIKPTRSIKDLEFKRGEEVMSPEGVEERVEVGIQFLITLTQGGKYRLVSKDMIRCLLDWKTHAKPCGVSWVWQC